MKTEEIKYKVTIKDDGFIYWLMYQIVNETLIAQIIGFILAVSISFVTAFIVSNRVVSSNNSSKVCNQQGSNNIKK